MTFTELMAAIGTIALIGAVVALIFWMAGVYE